MTIAELIASQEGATVMTAIDKAALIEQAANALSRNPCDRDWSAHLAKDCPQAQAVLPVIAKALLAPLRELHKPVNLIFSWNSGVRSEDPCETCGGKAGTHECGCWGDYDLPVYCEACSAASEFKRSVAHPCPTVRLLDAIEGKLI